MRRRLPLLFSALPLLWPLAASARSPAPAPALPQVQINVAFCAASSSDIDNFGINFEEVPLHAYHAINAPGPARMKAFLNCASGYIAAQLYQTLTRTGGKAVLLPPVVTAGSVPAALTVNDTLPVLSRGIGKGALTVWSRPRLTACFQIYGKLTLTPDIGPGGLVSLKVQSPVAGTYPVVLRPIPSGESWVIAALQNSPTDTQVLGGLLQSIYEEPNAQEVLIFITLTVRARAGGAGE